jgi:deoxyribodipyrimidine photo-lyase
VPSPTTPFSRIRPLNQQRIDPLGSYVLYWMTANRRTRHNFGLQRAVELSIELQKPLLVLEAVRVDYPHASDRLHTFLIDGMRDNARAFEGSRATYHPYLEPESGAGRGLVAALAAPAALVVTDWFPAFFLPRMTAAAAARCPVRLEAVDASGLIPTADHGRAFPTARGYRAFVQRSLRERLGAVPLAEPLSRLVQSGAVVPRKVLERWPSTNLATPASKLAAALPIDHSVGAVSTRGGPAAADGVLRDFLSHKLSRYAGEGHHPDTDCTSRLSPYLHFGHISAHEVFSALMTAERWTTRRLGPGRTGAREGWWNVSPGAEHFLDQLVVWRELAFNGCAWGVDYRSYDSLPRWARATLEAHLDDPRPQLYSLEQLDAADTSDRVWNAAQNELRQTGWCHGYLRMLWGKKILEWCRHPAEALSRMEALMNRHSLDGRDPVSYLNYAWVLGQYDRPWFERPVFGTVRCMTSESALRKLRMKNYLARFSTLPGSAPVNLLSSITASPLTKT